MGGKFGRLGEQLVHGQAGHDDRGQPAQSRLQIFV